MDIETTKVFVFVQKDPLCIRRNESVVLTNTTSVERRIANKIVRNAKQKEDSNTAVTSYRSCRRSRSSNKIKAALMRLKTFGVP